MAEEKEKKLIVEDLHISFRTTKGKVKAVRGVDFELEEGETLAIVGESGSGKSVTNRAIMGILAGNGEINQGKIIYDGQDLTQISEEDFHRIRGNKIGMIFQDPMSSLNPIMRIEKQITEAVIINGKHLKRRYKRMVHRYRTRIHDAKAAKKALSKEKREEKKALKEEGKSDQLQSIDDKYKQKKQKAKQELKNAKKAYRDRKKEAKAQLNQEWKDEKAAAKKDIENLQAKLKSATDEESKKTYKQQIEARKEKMRRFKKVTKKEARERAAEVMREVGIPNPERRMRQYPFQFSGGMRQRIVIAIALTADPDLLICDEPTTALDVTIQAQILDLIKRLKQERSLSVIFITHDLGVVAHMADRIAVMYAGKIVEIGGADEIFYNPQHPYTWALLSSMPDLESEERLVSIPGTPPDMLNPPEGDAFADRNRYALNIDFKKQPPFFKVSDTHYAATWLLHEDAPEVEKPEILQERIARAKREHEEVND